MRPFDRKQLKDAALGFLILTGLIVGSLWMAGVLVPVFGPDRSGMFTKR